jgi:hypothetical protein
MAAVRRRCCSPVVDRLSRLPARQLGQLADRTIAQARTVERRDGGGPAYHPDDMARLRTVGRAIVAKIRGDCCD